jgi:signal peptidase I
MPSTDRLGTWARRILDAALAILIVTTLAGVLLGRVVPLTGRSTFVVGGGSMAPAIGRGWAVVVEPVDPGAIAVGDIVSLRSGPAQAIFTHRVIRVIDRDGAVWIATKGDANAAADPSTTPATAVIGRVTLALPAIGYLIAVQSTPVGIVFVVSLGLLLLLAGGMLEAPGGRRRVRDPGPPMEPAPGRVVERA